MSNIHYPYDVFISTSVCFVQRGGNSQVFMQNQSLTVAFTVFSHEHMTKQSIVSAPQLALTLLGPELETVLLNQCDTEVN